MNILFLAARYHPAFGGVETHVLKLSRELVKKGHTIRVITESLDGSPTHTARVEDVEVTYINFGPPGKLKKFRIWWQMLGMRRYVDWADVVHCHDVFIWYLPWRFLMPWKPVFMTFHGYETVIPPRKRAIFIRRVSNFLCRGSIHIGKYLEKWYGTRADVTLYGAIDAIPKHLPKPAGKLHITLIGRLEKDIGIDTYVQVLKILQKKGIRFTFEACGDGGLRGDLETFGTVHGFVTDVKPAMQRAHIIFAASYLTILDALAFGKRICAVYENELKKDALADTPFRDWICLSDNPQVLADYIEASQKEKFALPHADDIQKFLKTVTWEHVADEHLRLWKK